MAPRWRNSRGQNGSVARGTLNTWRSPANGAPRKVPHFESSCRLFFSSSLCSFITDLTSTSHADCSTHRYTRPQRCLLSPKLSTMKVAAQQHACLRHPCQLAGICHDGCQAIHNVSVPAPSYALFCLDTGHGGHQCCETRCARTSASVVDSVGGLHLQLLPCPGGEWGLHCSPRFTVCIVHEQLCRQTK